MRSEKKIIQTGILLFALCAIAATIPLGHALATGYRDIELPAGTIVKLSMDSSLTSQNAQVGDPFTATVIEEVRNSREVVIPNGSKIKGRVSSVTPAQRSSRSGTLSIEFEQIVFPNGQALQVEGQLTSLNEDERRQIDEEGRVSGDSSLKRNVIFIGGGAGGGAIIGAIAGGGKGAGIGAGVGGIIGVLGAVLSKGEEAQVQTGQKFAMEILRPLRAPAEYAENYPSDPRNDRYNDRRDDRRDDRENGRDYRNATTDFASQEMIRRAQLELRDQGYYRGSINGLATPTRVAFRSFQSRSNLQQTGSLNSETALALGLINENGAEITLVRVLDATAERINDGSIRVRINAQTNSSGWQVFTSTKLERDTLRVIVKGTPSRRYSRQVLTTYPVETTMPENGNISRVVVQGEGNPINLELSSGGLALVRQARQQTASMLETYKRAIGVSWRTPNDLGNISRLTEAQAQVLPSLNDLNNSALFVEQLINAKAPAAGLRGSILNLVRQARQTNRLLDRSKEMYRLERQWTDFESNLRSIGNSYQVNYDTAD
jgi:hypothetical protein